jgi:hypothetical protein
LIRRPPAVAITEDAQQPSITKPAQQPGRPTSFCKRRLSCALYIFGSVMTDIFLSERRMLKQMFLVRIGLAIAFGAFSATTCQAAEVSLFDASGEAVAYIDTDDELTIYLWSGKPVAYLEDVSGGSVGVWGFNGKHLGWLERGAIWAEDGNATCATKEAMTSLPHLESLKSLKELVLCERSGYASGIR